MQKKCFEDDLVGPGQVTILFAFLIVTSHYCKLIVAPRQKDGYTTISQVFH